MTRAMRMLGRASGKTLKLRGMFHVLTRLAGHRRELRLGGNTLRPKQARCRLRPAALALRRNVVRATSARPETKSGRTSWNMSIASGEFARAPKPLSVSTEKGHRPAT
jgi:hypothetical protein